MKKNLLIIDQSVFFRNGVVLFLNHTFEGFFSIAQCDSIEQALGLFRKRQPDIILVGLDTESNGPMPASAELIKTFPKSFFVAMASCHNNNDLKLLHSSGQASILIKSDPIEYVSKAINAALNKTTTVSQSILLHKITPPHLINSAARELNKIYFNVLSERERNILGLLRAGLTNPEIGKRLGIETKTVYNHRYRIMQKLKIKTYTELVMLTEKIWCQIPNKDK